MHYPRDTNSTMCTKRSKRKYTPRKRPSRDFVRESGMTINEITTIIDNSPSLRQAAKKINTSRDSLLKFIRKYNVTHPKDRRVKTRKVNEIVKVLNKLPHLKTLNMYLTGFTRMHSKAFKEYRLDLSRDLQYVYITAELTTGVRFTDKYELKMFLDYFKGE